MPKHNNLYQQLSVKDSFQQSPPSEDGDNLYEQLLAQGFSKQEIHSVIHKFIMHEIACEKAYQQLSPAGKIKWKIKRYLEQATAPFKSLTQKGLTLLKTQFAKKPKNPV